MASVNDLPQPYLTHLQRTAQQTRNTDIHAVTLRKITSVANNTIRLLRLDIDRADGVKFLPGQWLDVRIPSISKIGGFTITSPPSSASPHTPSPYLELAVQNSPFNPPAAWFFRPEEEILGEQVYVRVGGSFVWPPFRYMVERGGKVPRRAVFVAGGVGINPLMSMLSHMHGSRATMPEHVELLYASKATSTSDTKDVLFADRITDIAKAYSASQLRVQFFLSSGSSDTKPATAEDEEKAETVGTTDLSNVAIRSGRITREDIEQALGEVEGRRDAVCYVCGPRQMTDELVEMVGRMEGMDAQRVVCEKWW